MPEARYYKKLSPERLQCALCPNFCVLAEGETGRCGLRKNEQGTLFALSYGNTVTVAIDPIEKKPLYHFLPGSRILSIGPNGCTLQCDHCQNWNISQQRAAVRYLDPPQLVDLARENESRGVAFTYTEPLLWFEYLLEAAPLLRKHGLRSVLVTNGYLNEEPAREIVPLVDAFNIDLKSFHDKFYRDYCGGSVEPVKRFIELAAPVSHVEVTNLLIPGLNDSRKEVEELARFLAAISKDIPLHISRFFPHFRMRNREATSPETMTMAYETARRYLDYVYIGNIFIAGTEDTVCPGCGEVVIRRAGYAVETVGTGGICPGCGIRLKGVWN
ncbi:MAG: AmmeMemoRadiSam system radical SAM enzyme [Candidatus Krumholzibacteriota bacterium]|nr:AmmeMemoRadiSam system radical SAM enzyme [Candidatus Krumholzibacteriota bacterium]